LTEKRHAKSEAWKSFREIQDEATKEKTGAVLCVKCHSVLSYTGKKVELPLNRHSCKFSAGQGNVEKHLHPSSLFRPVPQTVKDVVTEACVSLCCKDIRPFDIVTGSGVVDCSQSLVRIGSLHGNLNVGLKICYHILVQFPVKHKRKLKRCANHSSPVFSH
jgi:hypothetical protein